MEKEKEKHLLKYGFSINKLTYKKIRSCKVKDKFQLVQVKLSSLCQVSLALLSFSYKM